jgi:hypothetical protein
MAIGVLLEDGLAMYNVKLTYCNASKDSPYQCTFELPVDKDTVVTKLVALIDDRVIEA